MCNITSSQFKILNFFLMTIIFAFFPIFFLRIVCIPALSGFFARRLAALLGSSIYTL